MVNSACQPCRSGRHRMHVAYIATEIVTCRERERATLVMSPCRSGSQSVALLRNMWHCCEWSCTQSRARARQPKVLRPRTERAQAILPSSLRWTARSKCFGELVSLLGELATASTDCASGTKCEPTLLILLNFHKESNALNVIHPCMPRQETSRPGVQGTCDSTLP